MTRIVSHQRRLTPISGSGGGGLIASNLKLRMKEERKKVLRLSVRKLKAIEDPEVILCRSVLINNTLRRLQGEVREEKLRKKFGPPTIAEIQPQPLTPAPQTLEDRINHNGNNSTSVLDLNADAVEITDAPPGCVAKSTSAVDPDEFIDVDDYEDDDSSSSGSSSGSSSPSSDSSSSDEDSSEEDGDTKLEDPEVESPHVQYGGCEELLSAEVLARPPPQLISQIDDHDHLNIVPSSEAEKVSNAAVNPAVTIDQGCDMTEDQMLAEAERTECWTKPLEEQQQQQQQPQLVTSTALATPSYTWVPSYTPSTVSSTDESSSSSSDEDNCSSLDNNIDANHDSNFVPNICVPETSTTAIQTQNNQTRNSVFIPEKIVNEKCFSCGQSSMFQNDLQSVVFNSLIASLES